MQLRPYQAAAVEAVYAHLRTRDDNPVVVIPTGGGKTPVMATICRDAVEQWNGRVLILAHVKELLEQSVEKLRHICPTIGVGVYSAGLGRRDTGYSVTVAGIQSAYQQAKAIGHKDLILIDEAHLIPPGDAKGGDGMYRTFLKAAREVNPAVRVVGFTATPFRMTSGPICAPPPDGILNSVCYEVGVRQLIRDGYLCPLKSKGGTWRPNTEELHVRAGEFVAEEVNAMMDVEGIVAGACREIVTLTAERKSVLIFAAGVEHGQHVAKTIEAISGQECGFVDGNSPSVFRDQIIARFRDGKVKFLCNVNVLTTGFDAPNVDCVVLLRPTMSPGLYYQMVGRGFRLAPGKTDCLVLDYGCNVTRHGPVDMLQVRDKASKGTGEAPAKECPECKSIIAAGYRRCPDCNYEFPLPNKNRHGDEASVDGVLSGEVTIEDLEVIDTRYHVHHKKGAPDAPPTMRVEYEVGWHDYRREWVCFEHQGYARRRAEDWWRSRSRLPVPDSVDEAVRLCAAGCVAIANRIKVRKVSGEKYDRIIEYDLGDIPEADPPHPDEYESPADEIAESAPEASYPTGGLHDLPDDEIPF